jgi:hypothetical protein
MKKHVTAVKVDDLWYRCLDVGCPDFDRAAENRRMLTTGLHKNGTDINSWWRLMEHARNQAGEGPLPSWVPFELELPKNKHSRDELILAG